MTATPLLRVVKGSPTPEELAALVAVVAARAATASDEAPQQTSGWTDHGRGLRRPLEHGPGAWRRSAQPL